uniref:Uncharacterized protein LOC111101356 n=1 Tax=Crassostrea virginica TaxID=6565 RepID=A0A8B8ADH8_CRAVI|nr:uncharacterized protein LOC111101356 [Crassostrea virginica]
MVFPFQQNLIDGAQVEYFIDNQYAPPPRTTLPTTEAVLKVPPTLLICETNYLEEIAKEGNICKHLSNSNPKKKKRLICNGYLRKRLCCEMCKNNPSESFSDLVRIVFEAKQKETE